MAKLVQLTDPKTNENIYPQTPTKAIINTDGSNLSTVDGIVKGDGTGNFIGIEETEVELVEITPTLIGAQPQITIDGLLKGDGNGNITAAEKGTDYLTTAGRAVTVTIRAANWNSTAKSVTAVCSGVTADSNIIVTPSAGSFEAYCQAGVRCTSATTNTLAFKCSTVPTVNLTVNVLILS